MHYTTHSFETLGTHFHMVLLIPLMSNTSRVNYLFTCINSYFKIVPVPYLVYNIIYCNAHVNILQMYNMASTLVLASCYLCIHAPYMQNYYKYVIHIIIVAKHLPHLQLYYRGIQAEPQFACHNCGHDVLRGGGQFCSINTYAVIIIS